MAEQQVQAPRAPRRVVKKSRDMQDVVREFNDSWTGFQRALAGHLSLSRAYASFTGELPEEERQKGLPVWEFAASADGNSVIRVAIDVKRIDPEHVAGVLIPCINVMAGDMLETLGDIKERIAEMESVLNQAQPA